MQSEKTTVATFTKTQLKEEETVIIKAGGESETNPLYIDPAQQGENPLHGGKSRRL